MVAAKTTKQDWSDVAYREVARIGLAGLNIAHVAAILEWSVLMGVLGLSALAYLISVDWYESDPTLLRNPAQV